MLTFTKKDLRSQIKRDLKAGLDLELICKHLSFEFPDLKAVIVDLEMEFLRKQMAGKSLY